MSYNYKNCDNPLCGMAGKERKIVGYFCYGYEEKTPITNADHIRSMSDEELATMLKDYKDCSKNCVISNGKNCYQICEEESVLLKWLKQPFEGE